MLKQAHREIFYLTNTTEHLSRKCVDIFSVSIKLASLAEITGLHFLIKITFIQALY